MRASLRLVIGKKNWIFPQKYSGKTVRRGITAGNLSAPDFRGRSDRCLHCWYVAVSRWHWFDCAKLETLHV